MEKTLTLQPRVLKYLKETGQGIYKLSPKFMGLMSDPRRPNYWNAAYEQQEGLKLWGNTIKAAGVRVVASLPEKFYDHRVGKQSWVYFNDTRTREFTKYIMFWLQGMTEIFEYAGLDDARIITNAGYRLAKHDHWDGRLLFDKRFRSLDALIRRRLVIRNSPYTFDLSDCLAMHDLCGVPVLPNTLHAECHSLKDTDPDAIKASWGSQVPMAQLSSPRGGEFTMHAAKSPNINIKHLKNKFPYLFTGDYDLLIDTMSDGVKDAQRLQNSIK